jgi:hypothetical protein
MNIVDLDNNTKQWNLKGYISKATATNKSTYHIRARQLLHELFPTLQILEEVSIPVRPKEVLYLDFYLPLIKTCVEVHGEQHYKFIPFYHTTKLNFLKAKKRDNEKKEWCEQNNITYVELPYNENLDDWTKKIDEY